jgi:hypothetical protein
VTEVIATHVLSPEVITSQVLTSWIITSLVFSSKVVLSEFVAPEAMSPQIVMAKIVIRQTFFSSLLIAELSLTLNHPPCIAPVGFTLSMFRPLFILSALVFTTNNPFSAKLIFPLDVFKAFTVNVFIIASS